MATALHRLSFEKPIYELEEQIAAVEAERDKTPERQEDLRRLKARTYRSQAKNLHKFKPLANGAGGAASRSAHDYRLFVAGVR